MDTNLLNESTTWCWCYHLIQPRMWTEKNTGQLSLRSSEWKFLVAILFIEYITSAKTILLITPPSRLPFWLLLITRDVRAARRGGTVLARRVLLLKQDGCARRRSSGGGGELRQCRGGGARNSLLCVFLVLPKEQQPRRGGDDTLPRWCWFVSVTFYGNGF